MYQVHPPTLAPQVYGWAHLVIKSHILFPPIKVECSSVTHSGLRHSGRDRVWNKNKAFSQSKHIFCTMNLTHILYPYRGSWNRPEWIFHSFLSAKRQSCRISLWSGCLPHATRYSLSRKSTTGMTEPHSRGRWMWLWGKLFLDLHHKPCPTSEINEWAGAFIVITQWRQTIFR